MNTLEERLRAALEETAEEIAPHSVPPLRLRPPRRPQRLRLLGIAGRDPWATWLAPLAAAAAVAAVIIASVAVSGTIGGGRGTGPASLAGGLPRYYVALRFSAHNSCCTGSQPLVPRTQAVVVDTATGAVLATIAPPGPHDTFVGVSGAADDRTFVLGVQKYGTPSPTRFYLLRLGPGPLLGPTLPTIAPTATGPALRTIAPTATASALLTIAPTATASAVLTIAPTPVLTPIPPVEATGVPSPHRSATPSVSPSPRGSATPSVSPTSRRSASPSASPSPRGSASPSASPGPLSSATPVTFPGHGGPWARLSRLRIGQDTAQMMGFALSPQGTSLAVFDDAGLHVIDLATGAQRTWDRPVACFGGRMLGSASTDAMLSWAADGRHLATACYTTEPRLTGVWLLDTSAPGGNLVSDSRLLVPGPAVRPNGQPPWNRVLLTADGRTVVGVLEVPDPHRSAVLSPIQELAEYSAQTGKLLRVLNRMPVWNWVDFEQVLWASPDGHSLLVSDTMPYQGRRRAFFLLNDAGILTGHHFTPLRGWSLDTMAVAF